MFLQAHLPLTLFICIFPLCLPQHILDQQLNINLELLTVVITVHLWQHKLVA